MNFAILAMNLFLQRQTNRLAAYRRGENYVDESLDVVRQSMGNYEVSQYFDRERYVPTPGVIWAANI